MRRKDREMDEAFAHRVIDECAFATLSMIDEEGKPYCVAVSPVRRSDEICFHSARHGMKTKAMRANPTVCMSFVMGVNPLPERYSTDYESATIRGKAQEVETDVEKLAILHALCERYAPSNMAHFDQAIADEFKRTAVWKVPIEEITGKKYQ